LRSLGFGLSVHFYIILPATLRFNLGLENLECKEGVEHLSKIFCALGQESIFGFWGNLGWLTCCLVPSRSAVAGGFLSLSILAHNASL
jgi:hypothetical protein